MQRIYISPIVPMLSRPDYTEPKIVQTYPVSETTNHNILPNPFGQGYAIVKVETPDHRVGVADPDNLVLPDLSMDTKLGTNWNATVRTFLTNAGFDISRITSQSTLRFALDDLGRQFNSNFDVNNFDVRL